MAEMDIMCFQTDNNTDKYKPYVNGLRELPDILKNAAPEVFTKVAEFLTSFVDHYSNYRLIQQIYNFLNSKKQASAKEAEELSNCWKTICPELEGQSETIKYAIQRKGIANAELLNLVKSSLERTANAALRTANLASFAGLTIEAGKFFNLWNGICECEAFVNQEFSRRRQIIQRKLDRLPDEIASFAQTIKPCMYEHLNYKQRLRFHLLASGHRDSLRRQMEQIKTAMDKLETIVDGRVHTLSSIREAATPDAIQQGVQGAAQAMNLRLFWQSAQRIPLFGTFISMTFHFIAASLKISISKKSNAVIEELRNKLLDIEELKDYLENEELKLDRMFKDFTADILVDTE